MKIIDTILAKEQTKLTFKERQVNDGVIDYYEDIEKRILNVVTKLRIHNEQKAA